MRARSASHVFAMGSATRPCSIEQEEKTIISLLDQGRLLEAERMARNLIISAPIYGFGWKAHGLLLSLMGKKQEALPIMQQAAKLLPHDPEAFTNLGKLFIELKQWAHAQACLEHALKLSPQNALVLDLLIEAVRQLDHLDELLPLLERRIKLGAADAGLRHLFAMLSGHQTQAAPTAYVEQLFDEYAATFDEHLCETLAYQTPWQLMEMLPARLLKDQTPRVLDLGCGTGLMAQALGKPGAQITGVDLSPKMLDKARAKGQYQQLVQADVTAYMHQAAASSFDLIVSADVFVYIGHLGELFREAARLLEPGGVFAFSIEDMKHALLAPVPDDVARGYRLLPTGRYCHDVGHLTRLATGVGLSVLSKRETVLRRDSAKDIQGCLIVCQR